MRTIALLAITALLVAPIRFPQRLLADPSAVPSRSLFAQAAARRVVEQFDSCMELPAADSGECRRSADISFLLLDAWSGAVLASRWEGPEVPIPLGSLVKPVTALAYGENHEFRYPTHMCRGTASGCWLPRGHGRVGLTAAIEYSCNSYFRMLTAEMNWAEVAPVARSLGLQAPESNAQGISLAGVGNRWRISPLSMAAAYVELVRRREQPGVRQIIDGMEQSAEHGTGAEVDRALGRADALVKTGTASCTHARRAPGDGFAIALMPAANPQILLLVRVHRVPGAQAAKTAGEILHGIEE
jgi:transpeptidase family protein